MRRSIVASIIVLAMAPALAAPAPSGPPRNIHYRYMSILTTPLWYDGVFTPAGPDAERQIAFTSLLHTFRDPPETVMQIVQQALDTAQDTGYPVEFQFDDWNFPDPAWADDPNITEWTDWPAPGETHGPLLQRRCIDWEVAPAGPSPNFASTQFRAEVTARMGAPLRAIAARYREWREQGRGYLLAGVVPGWESGYYTNLNPTTSCQIEDGVLRTGYAALTDLGYTEQAVEELAASQGRSPDEVFHDLMFDVVHDYTEFTAGLARSAGIPRKLVSTHFSAFGSVPERAVPAHLEGDGRIVPLELTVNANAEPGLTMTPTWGDLRSVIETYGALGTSWRAPEMEILAPLDTADGMLTWLNGMSQNGARSMTIWGWFYGPTNPGALEGIQRWLAGEDANTGRCGVRPPEGVGPPASPQISEVDYADSFTGGINDRAADGTFPVGPPNDLSGRSLVVEDCGDNPSRTWSNAAWSIVDDDSALDGLTRPYPGSSGRGSSTGFTQSLGHGREWGIRYGQRDDFVVQVDAVQTTDRITVTTGFTKDALADANGLTVIFRQDGTTIGPEVALYNPIVGEHDTGIDMAGVLAGEWHTYAVRFNLVDRVVTIYVDGTERGTVDLDTFRDGAFVPVLGWFTNQYVNVGFLNALGSEDPGWTDNFMIGAPG